MALTLPHKPSLVYLKKQSKAVYKSLCKDDKNAISLCRKYLAATSQKRHTT